MLDLVRQPARSEKGSLFRLIRQLSLTSQSPRWGGEQVRQVACDTRNVSMFTTWQKGYLC